MNRSHHRRKHIKQNNKFTPADGRETALFVLEKIEENDSYSNLELNRTLKMVSLDKRESAFATELVYGTLTRLNTLDWMLNQFVKQGIDKLDSWVRQLLRLSVYQIHYLDRVPDRAVVHQAVEITKKRGHKGISSFVNGVLRSILRQPDKVKIPQSLPVSRKIALEHSHPEWLVERWIKIYGEETTRQMVQANNIPPLVSIRVNPLKTTGEKLKQHITEQFPDAEIDDSSLAPGCLKLSHVGNIAETSYFHEGYCTIQDESSMIVSLSVQPAKGMDVLDACAAPGGKTTHMAELMEDQGNIVAADIHKHKKELIEQNVKRLGISIVETITADAAQLNEVLEGQQFDRVLLDAPCTGFGVIRRKPDLKWKKKEKDITEIVKLQYRILIAVSQLVKPGGILVYSTCTVEPKENQELIHRFIHENPSFQPDSELPSILPVSLSEKYDLSRGYFQILPQDFGSDGFFIARLRRVK